jgi:hypothetical protein
MNNFLFLSLNYRQSVLKHFSTNEEFLDIHNWDIEWLKYIGRPHWGYVNDLLGENQFAFNMKSDHFPDIEFKYHEGLPHIDDIFMNRAQEMADMDKVIDIFYSGGIDSALILTALLEVCPKDQLRIIMGTDFSLRSWPYMADRIKDYNFEIVEPVTLFSQAHIDKNVFTTGCEADRLFGSTGFPEHFTVKAPHWNDPEEENYKRWWPITRYTYLTQSWRYLQDIKVSKVDLDNYQPFFCDPDILKYSMNLNVEKRVVWHSSFYKPHSEFLKAKMDLRDFIAKHSGDNEWPYTKGKTGMFEADSAVDFKAYGYGVEAIYGDGTVIFTKDLQNAPLEYGINI